MIKAYVNASLFFLHKSNNESSIKTSAIINLFSLYHILCPISYLICKYFSFSCIS